MIDTLNHIVWGFPEQLPWLIALLLGAGAFVTFRLGFIQVRQVWHALMVVAGKYDDPEHEGDISHFAALSTALSATVGIGNIAGVATAIHYGGPGALVWMWLTAFFGMALKYAECTLSMQYRAFDDDGNAAGGPMYYIEQGLGPRFKWMAAFFAGCAVIASFGGGNMNQANTVAVSAQAELGVSPYVVGAIASLLVGVVILGGIKRIAQVSSKLAPSMAAFYVLGALAIIVLNWRDLPETFTAIRQGFLNPAASLGGSVAGVFSITLLWGVKRGLFSNEAGQGSAPIAHAAAKTDEPVREGLVAMLGPLIDTLIICTLTGVVIVMTGVWDEKRESEMPIEAATAIPVHFFAMGGDAEAQWIGNALAKLETVDSATVAQSIEVSGGDQGRVHFVAADGTIDNAVVLKDDRPFDGTMTINFATGAVTPDGLRLRGLTLQNSSALTAFAFDRGLSKITNSGSWIVTLCVFLFALSTMISWSYYGDRCVTYLAGSKYVLAYRVIYTGFVFLGSVLALEVVWGFGDLALGLMTVPNLIAVLLLSPKVVAATKDYVQRMKAS